MGSINSFLFLVSYQRQQPPNHDTHQDSRGTEEEDAGLRAAAHPHHHSLTRDEARQCGSSPHPGQEDGQEEETSQLERNSQMS